jgi:hypothetical protein
MSPATGKIIDVYGELRDFLSKFVLPLFYENIIDLSFSRGNASSGEESEELVVCLQFARDDIGELPLSFRVHSKQLNVIKYIYKLVVPGQINFEFAEPGNENILTDYSNEPHV